MHKLLALALALSLVTSVTSGDGDGGSDFLYGTDGSTVDVSGARSTPSSPGADSNQGPSTPSTGSGKSWWETYFSDPANVDAYCAQQGKPPQCGIMIRLDTDTTPAVTITDLASFAPNPITLTAEPSNIGIAGLPTNFLAA
ncbi:MAG: hypothetical protein QM630_02290, partial [Microbacterium sp.]